MTKRLQGGFAHFILILVAVAAIGVIGFFIINKRHNDKAGDATGWTEGCKGSNKVALTHSPMDLTDVATITPYGLVAGPHVTPIDHLYFYPKGKERDAAPVYAMADGRIIDITSRTQSTGTGQAQKAEYRLIMQHSCTTVTYYDLMTSLDPAIQKAWGGKEGGVSIPIKAGQVLGRIGAQSLDTAVYDMTRKLPGFIHPDLYKAEPWKVYVDDFFEYFADPLKSQLLAINTRKVAPYSGKIDYDQPGKLIGNWFLEGTAGYAGDGSKTGSNNHGYWDGHLAIFYYAIDGKTVSISVGKFGADGQPTAFAAKSSTPDPATVSVATGMVKYELIGQPQGVSVDGPAQQQAVNPNPPVQGVALFQVLDGEKLKVEFFAGKIAAQVTGFTNAAKTYYR